MTETERIQNIIEEQAQSLFNTHAKPMIIREMKKVKVKKIEQIMGVTFFTTTRGENLSYTDFKETTHARERFCEELIQPWQVDPWYRLINIDIEL